MESDVKRLSLKLIGTRELLQHSEQLANPMSAVAREMATISKKRGKSEDDFEQLAQIEFKGGLYFDPDIGPYIPGMAVERALLDSAKKEKLGTAFKAYAQVEEDRLKLEYKGPRDIPGLWKAGFFDQRMVKVQMSKTLRTRPKFPVGWSISPTIAYDETALDSAQILRCMIRAGEAIGIGDFRPRFGRFIVEA
jgi:hypothetical protein